MRLRSHTIAGEDARRRRIRLRIGVLLRRDGELPTSWIVQGIRGWIHRFSGAEIGTALCDMYADGILECERRTAPIHHGSRHGREWTYWRLADGGIT